LGRTSYVTEFYDKLQKSTLIACTSG